MGAAVVHRAGHPSARAGRNRATAPDDCTRVRSALEQLATEGLATLHDGYRHHSVGTVSPTERAYRLIRTVIHRSYLPGERFMTRFEMARMRSSSMPRMPECA